MSSYDLTTISFTLRVYSLKLLLKSYAASLLAGDFGFGSAKSYCILIRILDTSYVGVQLAIRISRQILPFAYTLGWKISVMNLTSGALLGY